jgi:hypothetical protein
MSHRAAVTSYLGVQEDDVENVIPIFEPDVDGIIVVWLVRRPPELNVDVPPVGEVDEGGRCRNGREQSEFS